VVVGTSNIFYPVNRNQANYYAKMSFVGGATLAAGKSTGEIQVGFHANPFNNYNCQNDYSYDSYQTLTDTERVTVYENDVLIWGTEP